MEILGLDKIRHTDDETSVNMTGLECIKRNDSVNITGLSKIRNIIETDMPAMSPFAVELIRLVNLARELDTEYQQFGSQNHHYEWAPVIPLSQVREFERRHCIQLPQGYVDFLTQVGNGGAGPDYGLYSLEQMEEESYFDHSCSDCSYMQVRSRPDFYTLPYLSPYVSADAVPLINSTLTPQKWENRYADFCRCSDNGSEAERDRIYTEFYSGTVRIADSGCRTGYMLVCRGDLSGEVISFCHGLEMPEILNISFEDWVLQYFKNRITSITHQ